MSDKSLRLSDLTALGNCVICGKKQLESGLPLFYVIEISRAGYKADAVRRAAGLEMAIGPLARVLGPDESLATVIDGPHRVFVHETCADVAHLAMLIPEKQKETTT